MVSARPDIPRFGNHHPVSQPRLSRKLGKDRRGGIKAGAARDDRSKIEAKPVDPAVAHEMAERVDHQPPHCRIGEIERIAAAGVVDQRAIGRAGIGGRIKPAQGQRAAERIALTRMVEHQIEDHADPRRVQRRHRRAQFGDPPRTQAGIKRHHRHRVVPPMVDEAQRRQVAFIDPGDHRHQFDGADVELFEVRDHRRVGEGGDGAALLRRDIGVKFGKACDIQLVD